MVEEPLYILKMGKMYLKAIYVDSNNPETHYVDELELTSNITDIYDSAKFKTYKKADYTRDILKDIFQSENYIEIIDINKNKEGVSDEENTNTNR